MISVLICVRSGHSAAIGKANPSEALVALQHDPTLVEENPEAWMPWNDAAAMESLGLAG
jgi:hypothetical protein